MTKAFALKFNMKAFFLYPDHVKRDRLNLLDSLFFNASINYKCRLSANLTIDSIFWG